MLWLVAQMWMFLLIAFLLGAAGAVWVVSGRRGRATQNGDGLDALDVGTPASAPALLYDAPQGAADDLTQIIGIDRRTEKKLNGLGVFHLRQIASWDDGAARWIEIRLNEPGRVVRERWSEQAGAIF